MTTPATPEDDLRCAEYALGVLDTAERRALEQSASTNPQIQASLDQWQQRIAPLAEDVPAVEPPVRVWQRIQRDLGFAVNTGVKPAAQASLWDNLNLWRWLGIGASVAAMALLAVNVNTLRRPDSPAPAVSSAYMVATIARQDGVAHWTATVDTRRANMVVVPAVKPTIAAGKATELWLIPKDAKPIALGVFAADQPASMTLPADILAKIDGNAVLAVSIEPPGGSPTGQPTGPVVATGAIRPA
ncbi:anti-sigma factor [Pandoraea captiosa]|uniref:Anti-sigma factor n=1 Tax=Pandoraea captiosa TaxID=2508302 RepID=A0A5E4ZMD0_9BURK|nr:anti-sigma factor [Pandoraea captiosa]VVE62156.1 anti-sigma factor [Pandoraea captiosa]